MVIDGRELKIRKTPEIDRGEIIDFEDLNFADVELEEVEVDRSSRDHLYSKHKRKRYEKVVDILWAGEKLSLKFEFYESYKNKNYSLVFIVNVLPPPELEKASLIQPDLENLCFIRLDFVVPADQNKVLSAHANVENKLRIVNKKYSGLGVRLWRKGLDYMSNQANVFGRPVRHKVMAMPESGLDMAKWEEIFLPTLIEMGYSRDAEYGDRFYKVYYPSKR